jgi:hypothetical protein
MPLATRLLVDLIRVNYLEIEVPFLLLTPTPVPIPSTLPPPCPAIGAKRPSVCIYFFTEVFKNSPHIDVAMMLILQNVPSIIDIFFSPCSWRISLLTLMCRWPHLIVLLHVELFAEYFLCIFFSLGDILYRCTIGLNKETINHS